MRYLLAFILIIYSAAAFSQGVRFKAECSAEDVALGESFKVSFVLENSDIRNINFPQFEKDGFSVVQGPVNESRYMNVNGRASYSESYVFILRPLKTGKLTLGAARVVTSAGNALSTKPLTINSVAASGKNAVDNNPDNLPASIAGKVFFRLKPSKTELVPGEQFYVDLVVYTQIDLAGIDLIKGPKTNQAEPEPTSYYDRETRIDILNGKQFASKIIYRFVLIAEKPGTIEIAGAQISIASSYYAIGNPRSRETYLLNSNDLSIKVKEFEKIPKTFGGAVGKFEMHATVAKTTINSDEVLKLLVTLNGVGDIKKITELPVLFAKNTSKPFEVYPPKIAEKLIETDKGKAGIKDFEFTMEPTELGDFEMRPTFTYYDTESGRFITIDTLIDVRVLAGKKVLTKSEAEDEKESDSSEAKLSFGEPLEKAVWKKASTAFFGSWIFWLLALVPPLVFAALAGSRAYLKQRFELMAKRREANKAERELDESLKKAAVYLKDADAPAFYQAISEAFKNFLGNKLKISKAELSKEILAEQLQGKADDENIRSMIRILKICELSVYAGQDNKQAMQRVFDDSRELISGFSKIFS
jgi:hypothetical protein